MREGYIDYKGYLIRPISWYLPELKKWRPKVGALRKEGYKDRAMEWEAKDALFATEEEADSYAEGMAKKWIDDHPL